MGTDIADFNNDGWVDVISLDMLPEGNERKKLMAGAANYDRFESEIRSGYDPQYMRNTLQLNNGNGTFSEIGQLAGIHHTDWSWCPLLADFDNDGLRDLYITNGFPKDITNCDFVVYRRQNYTPQGDITRQLLASLNEYPGVKLSNYLYQNNGNLTFSNKTQEWGVYIPTFSNGAAYADLDNDGDLDLVVNNINDEVSLFRNNAEKVRTAHHSLQIKLLGQEKNKAGLGTKIDVFYEGKRQFYEHSVVRGYASTVDDKIHFGLGSATNIDSIRIYWPDGKQQLLTSIQVDQVLQINYKDVQVVKEKKLKKVQPLFTDISNTYGLEYKHTEEPYVDFKIQPLLPQKYSQGGPGIAVGDVNGDGLEDFFVGGGFKHAGQLFFQQQNGNFRKVPITSQAKYEEDMGTLLFDADNDQDLDLYIVSGSSEFETGSPYYQDRLYFNDGKGNFRLNSQALPLIQASGSCVTACDYDKDGDLDLFVGGRIVPAAYPVPPQSFLLQNEGGKFTDESTQIANGLKRIGMVTSALWTDVDNDGWTDLMVVGEWMPVTLFKNQNGRLVNSTHTFGLTHTSGWWNSLAGGDFDNDGDIDYIAGNLGLNSRYKASEREPVQVYAKDFDGNGRLDAIMAHYIQGVNYPAPTRDDLISQILPMRRKYQSYASYARTTLADMFSPQDLKDTYVLKAQLLETVYLRNEGSSFTISSLPIHAQFAPVFGMLVDDYNGDGNLDVLLTGNSYTTEVETGRYDASVGLFLQGDGKGKFAAIPASQSGFFVDGDAKGMSQLQLKDGNILILAARNNNSLKAFTLEKRQKGYPIKLQPQDVYAEIIFADGRKRKQEFYYGSTYLSHSSRRLPLYSAIDSVIVYGQKGKREAIQVK